MRKNLIFIWGTYISRVIPGKLFYPNPAGEVVAGVTALQDGGDINIYVVTDGSDSITIDVGYRNNDYLRPELARLGLNPTSVSHAFLTHTDMDHAGAVDDDSTVSWVNPEAQIFMGREEEDLIQGRRARRFFATTPVEITRPHTLLDDGAEMTVGKMSVRAIHTPGHSIGHMAYLVNDELLFIGDLLLLNDGVARPFYRLWNMDQREVHESIRKLAALEGVRVLCTAHSGWTTDIARAFGPWRE